MMHNFLANNRDDLIARCAAKVAKRPTRNASREQLLTGVPLFLDQLTRTLEAEQVGGDDYAIAISGPSGGDGAALSEMGVSAAAHGKALLDLNYTVDQVVHDYGDLCQSITDLAFERDAPFTVDEFRTLNRCLDNAIADAVTEFSSQRDTATLAAQTSEVNQRLGFLMHELRNALSAATLATEAMRVGNLTLNGATGSVLQRSHRAMSALIERSLQEVKAQGAELPPRDVFSLAAFIEEAREAGALGANASGCRFYVAPVDPALGLEGNRELLLAALANLLGNGFKFTQPGTTVTLVAREIEGRVHIDVGDHCGGLRQGDAERLFVPFSQRGDDRTGVGLGLSIARQNVEADEGTLSVRNVPGTGCVFSINMPKRTLN